MGINRYTLLYLKWITIKDLPESRGNSAQCHVAAWMGGEFGGERTRVYVWLSPFAVDMKWSIRHTSIQKKKLNFFFKAGFSLSPFAALTISTAPIHFFQIPPSPSEGLAPRPTAPGPDFCSGRAAPLCGQGPPQSEFAQRPGPMQSPGAPFQSPGHSPAEPGAAF